MENELDDYQYSFKLKDFGLLIVLFNIIYISFSVLLYVLFNFSFISFLFGYIIQKFISLDNLINYLEQLYNKNKDYFINLLRIVDTYVNTFLNSRKNKNNENENEILSESDTDLAVDTLTITPDNSEILSEDEEITFYKVNDELEAVTTDDTEFTTEVTEDTKEVTEDTKEVTTEDTDDTKETTEVTTEDTDDTKETTEVTTEDTDDTKETTEVKED
jgi:hypothetical protein